MSDRVGIVVVSHSAPLARAALELAREMIGANPAPIVLAAGTADGGVGTDATRVAAAIEEADEGAGVVILMDLGSAVLSAELALEFVDPAIETRLVAAPFVEGLLAAAVRATAGAALAEVAQEAEGALAPKLAHLGAPEVGGIAVPVRADVEASTVVRNVGGLHARPAARLATLAAAFDATVHARTQGSPVDATSPLGLATLDARAGTAITVFASGPQAREAVAALIAEIDGGFGEELAEANPAPVAAARVARLGVSPGRAVGRAVVLRDATDAPAAGRIAEGDREAAAQRVRDACSSVANEYRERAAKLHGQAVDVLTATAAIAEDPAIGAAAVVLVRGGVVADRAVWDAVAVVIAQYRAAGGVLAARVRDLEDVRDRIIAALRGEPSPGIPLDGEPFVLVARDLAPADTATLDPQVCRAIVTQLGSPTSHTAILARDLGIPAVVGVADALDIPDGAMLLVDGTTGEVTIDPDAAGRASVIANRPVHFAGPGRTKDGLLVTLAANVGSPADAAPAAAGGAEGVGLFRTEFCFLGRADEPSVAEQVEQYRAVLRAFAGKRVVLRTLDSGSDKPLPFLTPGMEPNPALGVRGYRTVRTHPDVLMRQLDAIAQAARAEHADAWVMAPMIATIDEATDFVAAARASGLERAGVMVETPSAAAMAEELCAVVDFVSIGTNDLAQYTMAADRLTAELADLTDPWQPAVVRQIAAVAAAGRASGTPVGVCGESAGRPDYAPVLVGLGVTSLSMGVGRLGVVGAALAAVDSRQCEQAAGAVLAADTAARARAAADAVLSVAVLPPSAHAGSA